MAISSQQAQKQMQASLLVWMQRHIINLAPKACHVETKIEGSTLYVRGRTYEMRLDKMLPNTIWHTSVYRIDGCHKLAWKRSKGRYGALDFALDVLDVDQRVT